MLKSLYVSSFVIIDKMKIDFQEGMSVITGETGAGKSIVIDAIGQLCGNRSSASFVKKGCSEAVIEGVFDVTVTPQLEAICQQLHIEADDEFIITKNIQSNGKSQVKINYQSSTHNALKLLMPYLIDIHSQFETQKLFAQKNHILLLDEYAKDELQDLFLDYQTQFQQYKDIQQHLNQTIQEDMSDEQLDFLKSQLKEIEEVSYTDDEIDRFEEELKILQNYEKMNACIQNFEQLMNNGQGVLPKLKEATYAIQSLSSYQEFEEPVESIQNLYYNLLDITENILDTYRSFHFDEYRFNELQDILFKVNRLKRKYGFTMQNIQEYHDELIQKIQTIENREEYILQLQNKLQQQEKKTKDIAMQMHHIRKKYAKKFEADIHQELQDLYLDKAIFKVQIKESQMLQPHGCTDVQFMVSINQGQDLSLLNETASGGEISRIMLAIKTTILEYNSIDTIIFDEIDTGVSGKVATKIGEKMKKTASKKQVICITHLPQVAALADYHYCIEKKSTDDETITSIHLLDSNQKIIEIAKMLSGETMTQEAIANAKKLLDA